jgi:hypothetical protein
MEVIMGEFETLAALWQYLDLSEKKRLIYEFSKIHGDHFSKVEFFEFLADKYDDSQIEFESGKSKLSEEVAV